MSEYQYYEFLAIDKPLTEKQIDEVRRYSSRAEITPTSFTNVYNFGDFRGDPREFIVKYFDAMVYVANWGTHRFLFRVPKDLLDLREAKLYCPGDVAEVSVSGQNAIFDLDSREDGGDWEEGSGWMASLSPLREELIGGDQRVLYLAWLLWVQDGDAEDDDREPPVPPGLARLTAAQTAFVEFMRLDEDLVAAAAQQSEAMKAAEGGLAEWIAALPQGEKDQMLLALCAGSDTHIGQKLHRRFREAMAARTPAASAAKASRTVGELRAAAATAGEQRQQAADRRREKERAAREAREAAARAKYLAELAGRQEQTWAEVERLVAAKQAKAYDQAVSLLCDLRDVAKQSGQIKPFRQRVTELQEGHAKKGSLLDRMTKANVMGQ